MRADRFVKTRRGGLDAFGQTLAARAKFVGEIFRGLAETVDDVAAMRAQDFGGMGAAGVDAAG